MADAELDFESLRKEFVAERPVWVAAAKELKSQLDRLMRSVGIPCAVAARPKDVPNLVRKGMKNNRTDLSLFGDRAGGRVTVEDKVDVQPATDAIIGHSWFEEAVVDEVKTHEPDRFGYLGTHLRIRLPKSAIDPFSAEEVAGHLDCEVQIHTQIQTLWANTSHPLTYKGPGTLPEPAERSIYQLAALSEIYDDVLSRARQEIVSAPGYEIAALVADLERPFLAVSGRDYDQGLSEEVLSAILPAFDGNPQTLRDEVASLLNDQLPRLTWTYERYSSAGILLLDQPESLAVFAGFENRLHSLMDAWSVLPRGWLEELAGAWRISLPAPL